MYTVTGSPWVPRSALEHAQDMLAAMNTSLAPLGITLKASMANVVWWICLGIGALRASYDLALSAAKNSFDPALCDDDQLLNLLPVTGIEMIPASASTLNVKFVADSTGQTVPERTHVKIKNQDVTFLTNADLVVPPGVASVYKLTVSAYCTANGNITVAGAIIAVTTAMNTTALVAAAIAAASFADFTASVSGSEVTFTGRTAAIYPVVSVDYAATGVAGTVTTIQSGTNGYAYAVTTCDTLGEIQVGVGRTDDTVEALPHIVSITNEEEAVAGSEAETITQVRARVITGRTIGNNLDGLATALRSLAGIQYAATYFNVSLTDPLVLPGSISLPPRTLYMVVRGDSDSIAQTYAERSLAPTYGAQTQNYVTNSGQNLAVKYDKATDELVWVKVYVEQDKYRDSTYVAQIQEAVVGLSDKVTIGQAVTQELVAAAFANITYATVNGVEVSLNGTSYVRTAAVGAASVAVFSAARTVVVLE